MEAPLVSIISATYNHENYISDCIKSVQDQSYPHWEMIIINDGSTDNTKEVIEKLIINEPRVTLITQKNVGIFRLSETYNLGLKKSKGKYIAILEGDDVWEPRKLERQVKILEEDKDVALAWGKVQTVSADLSEVLGTHPPENPAQSQYYDNSPPGNILNLLYFGNYISALTIFTRKELLDKIGGFQQGYNLPLVDFPTLLELSLLGKFHFDNFLLGKWRIYPHQITKTYPVHIVEGRYMASKDHYERNKERLEEVLNVDFQEFEKQFKTQILSGYARSGRYKLIRKEFKGARKDYKKAIFYPGASDLVWRLRAVIGYIFSLAKTDVEGLAKLLGKPSYK